MSSGIVEAWKLYNDERSGVLFVVEDVTYNICEQRAHEFKIKKLNPKIKVFRRSLTQLIAAATLDVNKELILDGNIIAVVYYRSGYEPSQYPTEAEWNVRLMMERSKAIKCPSIQYHLAGTKKIQQVLTQPGVVEKFLNGEKISSRVRKIYTGMYPLDFTVEGDRAIEMAIENPENFVLKPQREGGGNNIFGKNIKTFLTSIKGKKERTSWILMDKIYPPSQKNYFIRPGSDDYEKIDADYEVGIFGVIIGDSRNIYFNKEAGYMVRSKPVTANEGGRLSGGALSSIYLV
ncbi:glutathione synthetase-like [Belonocnema kinseyi]|uniref:glutathione synthetase-like n=1 Tax=Belonocnema kinseyi TaxID=2817044 RepID=UPI00143CEDA2|nr:glutathione synthetase-like [Belonocnema kinseyi]